MKAHHRLEYAVEETWPPPQWEGVTILVAVSGGADSVALLRALFNLKTAGRGRLWVAHFNHRLRAEESDDDESFVRDLCRNLGVRCECGAVGPGEELPVRGQGLEASARQLRYAFLLQTAERIGARYVVTAHTADDQAETVLHRILRGTGIAGLRGMTRARPLSPACTLIRPMLAIRRADVLEYLAELGQPFRRDASNDDTRFTRNRIRHDLLPALAADFNPAVVEGLLRLASLAGEVQEVVQREVEQLLDRTITTSGRTVFIACDPIAPRYLVRELLIAVWRRHDWPLQAMGFAEWDLLGDMALRASGAGSAAPRKRMFPGGVTVEACDGLLRLERTPRGACNAPFV